MTAENLIVDEDVIGRIAAAAHAAASGSSSTFRQAWANVPVPLRATIAVAYLTGADAPLSENNVAKAGGYSRTTAKAKHGDTIEILRAALPAVLDKLSGTVRDGVSVAEVTAELQAAHQTIATLREQLAASQAERDAAISYARDLHRQLKPEYEENLRTRAERVIDVTPRLRSVPTPPTDGGAE